GPNFPFTRSTRGTNLQKFAPHTYSRRLKNVESEDSDNFILSFPCAQQQESRSNRHPGPRSSHPASDASPTRALQLWASPNGSWSAPASRDTALPATGAPAVGTAHLFQVVDEVLVADEGAKGKMALHLPLHLFQGQIFRMNDDKLNALLRTDSTFDEISHTLPRDFLRRIHLGLMIMLGPVELEGHVRRVVPVKLQPLVCERIDQKPGRCVVLKFVGVYDQGKILPHQRFAEERRAF